MSLAAWAFLVGEEPIAAQVFLVRARVISLASYISSRVGFTFNQVFSMINPIVAITPFGTPAFATFSSKPVLLQLDLISIYCILLFMAALLVFVCL